MPKCSEKLYTGIYTSKNPDYTYLDSSVSHLCRTLLHHLLFPVIFPRKEGLSSLILPVQSFLHPILLAQVTRNTIIYFELFWFLLLVKSMAKCKFTAHLSDPKRTPLPLSLEMLGLQRPWIKRQSAQTAVLLATSGICQRIEGVCYRGRKCMDLGCFPHTSHPT